MKDSMKKSDTTGDTPPETEKARPVKKVVVDDVLSEQKIISKRPEPEFKDKPAIIGPGKVLLNSKQLFVCPEPGCNARFTQELTLKRHNLKHLNRRLRCNFCGSFTFKSSEERQKHLDTFHPNLDETPEINPLQCMKCKKISTSAFALCRHIRRTHQDRKYPCTQCGFQYTQLEGLQQHLKYNHLPEGVKRPTYPCEICKKVFLYSPDLRKHLRTAHRTKDASKQYRCAVCNSIYYDKHVYVTHLRYHTQLKSFSCEVCNVHFRSNHKLNEHKESKKHKDLMKQRKKLRARVTSEKRVINSPPKKSLEELKQMGKAELFDFCWKRVPKVILSKIDKVRDNKAMRRTETRFKESKTKGTKLRTRQQVKSASTTEESYFDSKCVYCKQAFSDMEALKLHEKNCFLIIRNGQGGPFECPTCKKVFKRRHQLISHSIVHSAQRSLKCNYCDAKFKRRECQISHEKHVHFGFERKKKTDRIFTCNHAGCGKTYSTRRSLQRHVKINHLGARFSCEEPECGKVFSRGDYLKLHKEMKHAEEQVLIECKPCMKVFNHRSKYLAHSKKPMHIRKLKAFSWNGIAEGVKENEKLANKRKSNHKSTRMQSDSSDGDDDDTASDQSWD